MFTMGSNISKLVTKFIVKILMLGCKGISAGNST